MHLWFPYSSNVSPLILYLVLTQKLIPIRAFEHQTQFQRDYLIEVKSKQDLGTCRVMCCMTISVISCEKCQKSIFKCFRFYICAHGCSFFLSILLFQKVWNIFLFAILVCHNCMSPWPATTLAIKFHWSDQQSLLLSYLSNTLLNNKSISFKSQVQVHFSIPDMMK